MTTSEQVDDAIHHVKEMTRKKLIHQIMLYHQFMAFKGLREKDFIEWKKNR